MMLAVSCSGNERYIILKANSVADGYKVNDDALRRLPFLKLIFSPRYSLYHLVYIRGLPL